MKVNSISNIELEKMSFECKESSSIEFGKWMALNIMLQSSWGQIKQDVEGKPGSRSSSVGSDISIKSGTHNKITSYSSEEIYWRISSTIDKFNEEFVNKKVLSYLVEYQEKSGNKATISQYIECLHNTMQYFCEGVTKERIESCVLILLFDLSNFRSKEELSNLIGNSHQHVVKDINIDAILELHIQDFNKMANYSFFILSRESERFFLQAFLQMLIPDFKSKSKNFDKINKKFILMKKKKKRPKSNQNTLSSNKLDYTLIGSSVLQTKREKEISNILMSS